MTQPRCRTSTRVTSGMASDAPMALASTWLSGDVLQLLLLDHALVHEVLRDRLVARHLPQLPSSIEVAAAVADLQHVQPWPDDDAERERRRHLPSAQLRRRLGAYDVVRRDGRRAERS